MRIKVSIDLKVNRVVKYFILADLLLLAGWGLMEPIFSIYVTQKIQGATIATVGVSAAVYWLTKSLLQLPVANYLDRSGREQDNFRVLIVGLLVSGFSAFSFTVISSVWQLYAVQIVHAAAFALYIPAWSSIFSHHLDRERMSFDWSLDSTAVSLSMGLSGLLGGLLAYWSGFTVIFIMTGFFSLLTAIVLLMIPDLILPRKSSDPKAVPESHGPSHVVSAR